MSFEVVYARTLIRARQPLHNVFKACKFKELGEGGENKKME